MTTEKSLHKAAQAWCKPTTEHLEMIPELAEVFAEMLDEGAKVKKELPVSQV